jgi:RsiW-degrading membrane proteinase PrsW (M82 family)
MFSTLSAVVFGLELILTIGLIIWLLAMSRGEQIPTPFIFTLLAYGGLAALIAGVIQIRYGITRNELQQLAPHLTSRYANALLGLNYIVVAVVEELAKYCAALFLIIHTRRLKRLSDAIFYLVIIGLGFSLVEDALFFLSPHIDAPYRLLSFYLHSGTSAVLGYGFARFYFKHWHYRNLLACLGLSILIHLTYNVFTSLNDHLIAFLLTLTMTSLISLQIFLVYRHTVLLEFHLERINTPKRRHKLLNL